MISPFSIPGVEYCLRKKKMNKAGLESDHDYCRLWLRISQYRSDLAKYRKEKQKNRFEITLIKVWIMIVLLNSSVYINP